MLYTENQEKINSKLKELGLNPIDWSSENYHKNTLSAIVAGGPTTFLELERSTWKLKENADGRLD